MFKPGDILIGTDNNIYRYTNRYNKCVFVKQINSEWISVKVLESLDGKYFSHKKEELDLLNKPEFFMPHMVVAKYFKLYNNKGINYKEEMSLWIDKYTHR